MRKKIYLFFIIFLLLIPIGTNALSMDVSKEYLIGGDEDFPPFEFIVDSGETKAYRGFNIDILKAIALQTGIEIRFQPMTWSHALEALDKGELDAIQGMRYDEKRTMKYDFSNAYFSSVNIIFTRKQSRINTIEDLKGKRIAVQKDDIAYQNLSNDPRYQITAVPNQEAAFDLLLSNRVDAVAGNKFTGQYILQMNKSINEVKMIGLGTQPEKYCVAVKKGNYELLNLINRGLNEIKENGTYDKIYEKWFGQPLDYSSDYYKGRFKLTFYILAIAFLLLLLMSYFSNILRREVNKRTAEIKSINLALVERNQYIKKENIYKEQILNSGYNGIVTIDCRGNIQFINSYASSFFKDEEIIGKLYSDTILKHFFNNSILEQLLKDKSKVKSGEVTFEGRYLEYTLCALYSEESIEGLVLNFKDVTTERQLREKVIQKDKREALGNLVAGIAHEIRTPLTSIKAFIELLPVKYNNPHFREKISLYVPQEIERVNNMVNNLLNYARPREPGIESVSILSLIKITMISLENLIERQNIKIILNARDDITVYADKQQVQQVLLNVLLNAVEALNGVENPEISISCMESGHEGIIVIEDSGPGIDQSSIKKVFDPFYTTKPSGTGLGLAISSQIIKENGGRILIDSKLDSGTKVSICLPTTKGLECSVNE